MPIAPLAVQTIARSGTVPSYSAGNASGGHSVDNNGQTFLHVKNTGTEKTINVESTATLDGLAVADLAVVIAATTGDKMLGPFATGTFGTSLTVTFTADATGITIAALRM